MCLRMHRYPTRLHRHHGSRWLLGCAVLVGLVTVGCRGATQLSNGTSGSGGGVGVGGYNGVGGRDGVGGSDPSTTANGVGGAAATGAGGQAAATTAATTAGAGGSGASPIVTCSGNQSMCGAGCVDTSTDPNNCGGCGNSCNGLSCCNGQCVDTSSDPNNCGVCGGTCASDQQCINDGWLVNKCETGQCKPMVTSCGAYRCNQTTKTCRTTCTPSAGECYTGFYCWSGNDTCLPQGNKNAPCQNANQCLSNTCSNGKCT